MDKKKPLKDWTLNELKEYCDERPCGECIFCDVERKTCRITGVTPFNWVLTAMPRWTEEDIADAKAIKRLYPRVIKVERYTADGMIKFICGGCYYTGHPGLLPSLALGECVALQEILDAEELLHDAT